LSNPTTASERYFGFKPSEVSRAIDSLTPEEVRGIEDALKDICFGRPYPKKCVQAREASRRKVL
jgi:hypothetical protein